LKGPWLAPLILAILPPDAVGAKAAALYVGHGV